MSDALSSIYPNTSQLTDEERALQREYRRLHWEIADLKKAAGVAQDKQRAAEADSHRNKLRAKCAEKSLSVLEQDAHRMRWLKEIGSEAALALLKRWETDQWDVVIDKARGAIR